jgi:hypothetical protein
MRVGCCLVVLVSFPLLLVAQGEAPSVAEAAKKSRNGNTKSKMVINEETFTTSHGPLPDLNTDGMDNSDDVVKAILDYRVDHTRQETEQVIRDWYGYHDHLLERAITDNNEITTRAKDRSVEPREYPEDYRKYEQQRAIEARAAIQDRRLIDKNALLVSRIQQGFYKVRSCLNAKGVKYEWFKIRSANGIGTY